MKKTLKYLVAYFFETGHGRAFMTVVDPIDTEERILEVEKLIKRDFGWKKVGVTNITLLKG